MGNIKWSVHGLTDYEINAAVIRLRQELFTHKKGTPAYDSCQNELTEYVDEIVDRQRIRNARPYLRGVYQSTTGDDSPGDKCSDDPEDYME